MASESEAPDHNDVADVSQARLTDLFDGDDPVLARSIETLVSLLRDSPEVTLRGWNSFIDRPPVTGSPEPSSTS